MRSLAAVLRLIRWENASISAAGVLVGAWWAADAPFGRGPLLAAAVAIFLTAVANAENDLRDLDIDAIVHPDRPLPSGALSTGVAAGIVRGAALGAVLLALAIGGPIAIATPVVLVVMLAYSRALKPLGLPGNLAVALLASLPFLYGGWSVGRGRAVLPLVALAVPLHLAREIAKDLDDARGDAPIRRTLPVTFGPVVARRALLGAVALFVVVLVPFVLARPWFVLFVVPALVCIVLAARRALSGTPGSPLLFKSAMVCAMASLLAVR